MMTADARFWDSIAEKYAAKPVEDVPAFERKKAITRAKLRREHTILDVGCGTGSLALELAPLVERVHAVDVSSEMLRIAEAKADAQNVDNVTFHRASLEEGLPFERGSIDGICAYSILHLVEDPAATLRTLLDLLKPGGFLVSSTVCLGKSWVPYGAMIRVMRWFGKAPRTVHILDEAELMSAIETAGFTEVRTHDVGTSELIAFVTASRPDPRPWA